MKKVKECKKTKYNKGMALAATLILMTIVLMMSGLMLSYSLYSSQLVGLSTTDLDEKAMLDSIGYAFVKNPAAFDPKAYVKDNASVKELENYSIKVDASKKTVTLTVVTKVKRKPKLNIECVKTGGGNSSVYELKSWNYGN